jgi:hypothetical protein
MGRFISEDSYWGNYNYPLSLNLYMYCGSNPVNRMDPTGHSWGDVLNGFKFFGSGVIDFVKGFGSGFIHLRKC